MHGQGTEGNQGLETALRDTIMMDTCLRYAWVQTPRMHGTKSEPQCKLWALGGHCGPINVRKAPPRWPGFDNGGGYAMRAVGMWDVSLLFTHFFL